MRRKGFDGTSRGTDANQAEARPAGPPLGPTVLKFPNSRLSAAASAGNMADGLSSGPSADFISLGDASLAVLMRLRGDLPRVQVWKQDD